MGGVWMMRKNAENWGKKNQGQDPILCPSKKVKKEKEKLRIEEGESEREVKSLERGMRKGIKRIEEDGLLGNWIFLY